MGYIFFKMKSLLYGLIYKILIFLLSTLNYVVSVQCMKHEVNQNCSTIQVTAAMIVRFSKKNTFDIYRETIDFNKNISLIRSKDILQFPGYDKDEIRMHSIVKDFRTKLILTVKLNNCGKTKIEDDLIILKHVYDPISRKRTPLLYPIVFKFRQELVELYGLHFIRMVNSETREEVLNKNMENFTGCDTTSSKPTCYLLVYLT